MDKELSYVLRANRSMWDYGNVNGAEIHKTWVVVDNFYLFYIVLVGLPASGAALART